LPGRCARFLFIHSFDYGKQLASQQTEDRAGVDHGKAAVKQRAPSQWRHPQHGRERDAVGDKQQGGDQR
jgi:hypothetical protein